MFDSISAVGLNEKDLELKAVGISLTLLKTAEVFTENLQKEIKEIADLDREEANKVFIIASCVLLFYVQKCFWESVFREQKQADFFQKVLFIMFEKTIELDPKPFIRDVVSYIKMNDSSEVQYIGSTICKAVNIKSAEMMVNISMLFFEILKEDFDELLKSSWNLPNETLKEMLDMLNQK